MRVLVTGAGGFIGSAVVRALRRVPGVQTIAAHHSPRPGATVIEVRDPATLACVAAADAVVHAAHAVSGDAEHLHGTNVVGTGHLLRAARRNRPHVVSVSTASVYGPIPWRGEDVQELPLAPVSVVSQTRAEADELVLEYGGTVVRPHLVHGPGDRWFVPRAREVLGHIGWPSGPPARHSTIQVEHLAERLAGLALRPPATGGVRLASDAPRTMMDVLAEYLAPGDLRHDGITYEEAMTHPAGTGDRRWAHDMNLLLVDHFLADSLAEADP